MSLHKFQSTIMNKTKTVFAIRALSMGGAEKKFLEKNLDNDFSQRKQ